MLVRFLLRNAEIEAVQHDFLGIDEYVVDTKVSNVQMIAFLESQGYSVKDIADLYGLDAGLDVVMTKAVR
jgi:hypothetical protein